MPPTSPQCFAGMPWRSGLARVSGRSRAVLPLPYHGEEFPDGLRQEAALQCAQRVPLLLPHSFTSLALPCLLRLLARPLVHARLLVLPSTIMAKNLSASPSSMRPLQTPARHQTLPSWPQDAASAASVEGRHSARASGGPELAPPIVVATQAAEPPT